MTRLTNALREQIATNAVNKAFAERAANLRQQQMQLALEVYNDKFPKEVREQMLSLRKGWLPTCDSLTIEVQKRTIKLNVNGNFNYYDKNNMFHQKNCELIKFIVPYDELTGYFASYLPDNKIGHKIIDFINLLDNSRSEYNSTYKRIIATLNTFSTVEKLVENWKEIAEFIPKNDIPLKNLPAIPIDELNTLLGLQHAK